MIICSKCGGINILCEAMIEPNTKQFSHYTDESFAYGWCEDCEKGTVLSDVDEVKNYITAEYKVFRESYNMEPQYANCQIVWKDTGETCNVRIMLSADAEAKDDKAFYYCDNIDELISLTEYNDRNFMVIECYGFAMLTEQELLERHSFIHEVNEKNILVTGKEVMEYYGQSYNLKKEEMERYAAHYTCLAKNYKESTTPVLDRLGIEQLLEEEKQIKKGQVVCFKCKFPYLWYVTIEKEDHPLIEPFRYILKAYCLDNIQTFSRRYVAFEDALLHCLNKFNENEHIPNRYKSIDECLHSKNRENRGNE